MLTTEQIKTMKQNNVSADKDLTMLRMKEVYKAATRNQKNEIDALAGLKRVSINRVHTTGSILTKIAVAVAQIMNINPYFLTGEAGEKGELSVEVLADFLKAKGYANLAKAAAKPPRKKRDTAKAEAPVEKPTAPAVNEKAAKKPVRQPRTKKVAEQKPVFTVAKPKKETLGTPKSSSLKMSEEEAVQLLRALYTRVKFNKSLISTLDQIQGLLK
jgi:hypothetical protein